MDQPTAAEALARLERLVGDWDVVATWPDDSIGPAHGRTTFAWHESGAHLIQTASIDIPEAPDSTSVIGCDAATGGYVQLYSDVRGVCRIYRMSIDENEWMLSRDGIPFGQRFVAHTSGDGNTMTGGWEADENGVFRPDFSVVYSRVT